MSEVKAQVIEPDAGFVRDIIANGGETLKKCFQCGNCSVVCNISPDGEPFPRKEMIWAQWGLKDKLMADADIWLCHHCGDCTTHCPRGAAPGDVLAAVRNLSFKHYAGFGFMGKLLSSPSYSLLLFLIPMVWIGGIISFAAKKDFMTMQPLEFGNMMPELAIDMAFLPMVGLAAVAVFLGITRFWKDISAGTPGRGPSVVTIGAAAMQTLVGVLKHEKMTQCGTNVDRAKSHKATLFGFIGCAIATGLVAAYFWMGQLGVIHFEYHELSIFHPARALVKLFGNIGGILVVTGVTGIIMRRYGNDKDKVGSSTFYDSFFITVLYMTIITGFLSEIFRVLNVAPIAFGVYYVHLVFVFSLLVYAPFSKFAHMFYRFAAITYANMVARERAK